MAVVVQGVVFRAFPGDRGLRASTNSTSQNNGLPCLTRDFTQGNDEFWGNCTRRGSVSLVSGLPVTPANAPRAQEWDLSSCLHPEPQETCSPRSHSSVLRRAPGPTTCETRRERTALTVINVVGIEKLKGKNTPVLTQNRASLRYITFIPRLQ